MTAATLATLAVLLTASALFSGAESAIFSLQPGDWETLRRQAPHRATILERWLSRPRRLLLTLLLCNLVVNVGYFSIAGSHAVQTRGWVGTAWTVLPLALLILLGEVAPKAAAHAHPRGACLLIVPLLRPVVRILAPLATALHRPTSYLLRRVGAGSQDLTPDDLRTAVSLLQEEEGLTPDQARVMGEVLSFRAMRVRELMIPRVDLPVLQMPSTREQAGAAFRQAGRTWLPVAPRGSDRVEGILELATLWRDAGEPPAHLVRQAPYIPEQARLDQALERLRASGCPAAVVVNEYGGAEGFVTLEAIVEEIVGDIADEFDLAPPPIRRSGARGYRILARCPLRTLHEELGERFEPADAVTAGGWVQARLGRTPRIGDAVRHGPWRFVVFRMRRHGILELLLNREEA